LLSKPVLDEEHCLLSKCYQGNGAGTIMYRHYFWFFGILVVPYERKREELKYYSREQKLFTETTGLRED
jgi:hypothetical protein